VRLSVPMLIMGLGAGLATLGGGLLALRPGRLAGFLRSFSTGAVLGVALLDLLPDALSAGRGAGAGLLVAGFAVLGFVGYLALDRLLASVLGADSAHRGHLGAGSLAVHSLMDGVVIGLAFQASQAIGVTVAAAVIAHDFSDGVNTVNLSLAGRARARAAVVWLVVDALAPLVGLAVAGAVSLPPGALSLLLAALAGGLVYVAVGRGLVPLRRADRTLAAAGAAVLGFAFIFAVGRLAGA